jgi:hypothetical protein
MRCEEFRCTVLIKYRYKGGTRYGIQRYYVYRVLDDRTRYGTPLLPYLVATVLYRTVEQRAVPGITRYSTVV